jgi:hypothetical protein
MRLPCDLGRAAGGAAAPIPSRHDEWSGTGTGTGTGTTAAQLTVDRSVGGCGREGGTAGECGHGSAEQSAHAVSSPGIERTLMIPYVSSDGLCFILGFRHS